MDKVYELCTFVMQKSNKFADYGISNKIFFR